GVRNPWRERACCAPDGFIPFIPPHTPFFEETTSPVERNARATPKNLGGKKDAAHDENVITKDTFPAYPALRRDRRPGPEKGTGRTQHFSLRPGGQRGGVEQVQPAAAPRRRRPPGGLAGPRAGGVGGDGEPAAHRGRVGGAAPLCGPGQPVQLDLLGG